MCVCAGLCASVCAHEHDVWVLPRAHTSPKIMTYSPNQQLIDKYNNKNSNLTYYYTHDAHAHIHERIRVIFDA